MVSLLFRKNALQGQRLIPAVQVSGIHLVQDVTDLIGQTVGNNNIRYPLEFIEVPDNPRAEESILFHRRFIYYDFHAFRLDALHAHSVKCE